MTSLVVMEAERYYGAATRRYWRCVQAGWKHMWRPDSPSQEQGIWVPLTLSVVGRDGIRRLAVSPPWSPANPAETQPVIAGFSNPSPEKNYSPKRQSNMAESANLDCTKAPS